VFSKPLTAFRGGRVSRRKLWEKKFPNGPTTLGLDQMLNSMFRAPGVEPWFIGLINNSPAPTLAAADTMASHAGWAELTNYGEATRPIWTEGAAAGGVITNAVQVDFTINASVLVYGGFVTSNSTKGGSTGILWATGGFDAAKAMSSGQLLRVTYSVTLTP
jgi:hypothetical protein